MYNPYNYFIQPYNYMTPINYINPTRNLGIFKSLNSSILKKVNWSSLFNNTSKALGVVNQAIPIVKQTKPMINNMRSMLKVASVFKDVTDDNPKSQKKTIANNSQNINNNNIPNIQPVNYYNTPNFFI